MQSSIQNALDELLSPRSPSDAKTRALQDLERQLALVCLNDSDGLSFFKSLQCTFECNIPLRVLAWIATMTPKLDAMTNKGVVEKEGEYDVLKMVFQLSLALSIVQGTALIHHASKLYLGRKHALETLLDLLLVSRHVPPLTKNVPQLLSSSSSSSSSSSLSSPPHLSSIVLDTLLCILVDSPNSLRSFENVNGVRAVVKILKRAGTPREVRMKCLEFLYFYLLDEDPSPPKPRETEEHQVPTAPVTPVRPTKKPYLSPMPMLPSSRQTSSASLLFPTPVTSFASTSSSRSVSSESLASMTSASTAPSSVASSPDNTSVFSNDVLVATSTPATSPLPYHNLGSPPPVLTSRPKSVHGKEADPMSPNPIKRRHVGSPPPLRSRHGPSKSMSAIPSIKVSPSTSRLGKPGVIKHRSEESPMSPLVEVRNSSGEGSLKGLALSERVKSTEEKKELLGTMLGNVDALVESVRKAGIWGLS